VGASSGTKTISSFSPAIFKNLIFGGGYQFHSFKFIDANVKDSFRNPPGAWAEPDPALIAERIGRGAPAV
jgi:hypothetical protein